MGDIELPGSVVILTYLKSLGDLPKRERALWVADGLEKAYRNNISRDFINSSIQLEEDGAVIYDHVSLALAMTRITTLVEEEKLSIKQATERVAEEDGHPPPRA